MNKMGKYQYFAQHMHMHSSYQPGGSMEGHLFHAANMGMKYIWFTDHDIRMGRKRFQIDGFDFEEDTLFVEEANGRSHGFQMHEEETEDSQWKAVLTGETSFTGSQCLKISGNSHGNVWKGLSVSFSSSGRRHCASLMAGITLEIAVLAKEFKDCRVILDVQMSQRPPEHTCAHLLYVIGDMDGLEAQPHTVVIPLASTEGWHKYILNLSEDVTNAYAHDKRVGGLDNAFDTISLRVEAKNRSAVAYFDDFIIRILKNCEETRSEQKRVAAELGRQYGITTFVATEISAAGPHKNCFSTTVPIIPYDKFDYRLTHEEAIAWVQKHGGIFALNHPFEEYKKMVLDEAQKEMCLRNKADEFIQNKAWGASLIEVGYPMGRSTFSLQMHLRLWDKLTEAGVFLTGYGSSDNHSNKTKWYDDNNFAAWIGVEAEEAEPIKEEAFIAAMKSGNVYTGNPVVLKGQVSLETEDGVPMGSVLITGDEAFSTKILFQSEVQAGWHFRFVSNGEVVSDRILDEKKWNPDNRFEFSYKMTATKPVNFVRAEMYDENGLCIMLTNPIHIWRKDLCNVLHMHTERMILT